MILLSFLLCFCQFLHSSPTPPSRLWLQLLTGEVARIGRLTHKLGHESHYLKILVWGLYVLVTQGFSPPPPTWFSYWQEGHRSHSFCWVFWWLYKTCLQGTMLSIASKGTVGLGSDLSRLQCAVLSTSSACCFASHRLILLAYKISTDGGEWGVWIRKPTIVFFLNLHNSGG